MKASSFYSNGFRFVCWIVLAALLCLPGRGAGASLDPFDIQAALDAAPEGGTVTIPAGTYTVSLVVRKNLTLAGQSGSSVTLQAPSNMRVIDVNDGKSLTIRDLNLTGGAGMPEGGAVRVNNGSLTVEHCYLYNNQAGYGGAIFQGGTGQVIVRQSSYIYYNHATLNGGGVYANGDLTVDSSTMYSNVADGHGGAATVWSGNLSVDGGMFSYNSAGLNGGALNVNNSLTINGATFTSNVSGADGGAILQWNGTEGLSVTVQDSTFDQNTAANTGGALSIAKGAETIITGSTFTSNQVDTGDSTDPKGGAVFFADASYGHTLTINDTTFRMNSLDCVNCSFLFGGGLYADTFSTGLVVLGRDRFEQNDGWLGGGVNVDRAIITRSVFQGNTAGYGAGAYLFGSSEVKDCTFQQNAATNGGSGFTVTASVASLSVEDSIFTGNSTPLHMGGAMTLDAETITLKNVVVADTQVGTNGSAILFDSTGSTITLRHVTVNDTHLSTGSRTGVAGIKIDGPTVVNIYNSMLTNHGIGVKIQPGSACALSHTLWYGNTLDIDGPTLACTNQNSVHANPAYALDRYHITSASGAIDQGVNRSVYTDLDGDTRDSHPDLGADEYRAHLHLPLILR